MDNTRFTWMKYMPNEVQVVTHYHKCIQLYPLPLNEETQAACDYLLVFIVGKQVLPFKDGRCEVREIILPG